MGVSPACSIFGVAGRGHGATFITSPSTSLGERSDAAFSRRLGEGANPLRLKTATPISDASCANAPSPEQRLKGVLDLSPGCAGGEVTEDRNRLKNLCQFRYRYQRSDSPALVPAGVGSAVAKAIRLIESTAR